MVILIDNYDSFAYNLYQLIGTINPRIQVIRNDRITVKELRALKPDHIILSPGPGRPDQAGICIEAVKELGESIPVLGVCLGHQAICEAYGATVGHARKLMHGKQSLIRIQEEGTLFRGLPEEIPVARYHSLAALRETIPEELVVTAVDQEGEIMAVRHKTNKVFGVQFHPESILTPDGETMIRNFLTGTGSGSERPEDLES